MLHYFRIYQKSKEGAVLLKNMSGDNVNVGSPELADKSLPHFELIDLPLDLLLKHQTDFKSVFKFSPS
jgi:hypothetical protein